MTYGTAYPNTTFPASTPRRRHITNHQPSGLGDFFRKVIEAFRVAQVAPPSSIERAYLYSFAARYVPRN